MPYSNTRPEWHRPRLAVTHWAPHDLRRTSRTLLTKLGCPTEVAEAILGHLPPGVQAVYNRHQYDDERKLWLKRLSTRLEKIASG
jgi:integrase